MKNKKWRVNTVFPEVAVSANLAAFSPSCERKKLAGWRFFGKFGHFYNVSGNTDAKKITNSHAENK